MVDVLKTLDIEYLAINCASSFRGLHEAIINTAATSRKSSPARTRKSRSTWRRATPRSRASRWRWLHGVVGLQHATMAMYNAWCDRVPVIVIGGNIVDADKRRPGAEWVHSGVDIGAIVRDFTKWDDQPASLQHFAESAVRAYKIATTPPMGPVLLALDAELQENPIPDGESLRIPKLAPVVPPQGDAGAVAEAAKMLVEAQNPVIIVDRMARTPAGMAHLVELAETLQCAVDRQCRAHELPVAPSAQSELPPRADRAGRRHPGDRDERSLGRCQLPSATASCADRARSPSRGAKIITLGVRDLYLKSNYQDFGRFQDSRSRHRRRRRSLAAGADRGGEAARSIRPTQVRLRGARQEARGAALAMVEQAKSDATIGWDASPITTARLCAEVYAQIKDEDWSLVGTSIRLTWPHRLWNFNKPHQWNGGSGGAGVGYNAPASLGAALANKKHGRLTVAFNGDGDFMFVPARCGRPRITGSRCSTSCTTTAPIIRNTCICRRWRTGTAAASSKAHIGTTLTDPNIDYATVARGMGVYGEGPITDPKDLAAALTRAIAVVKRGEPALVDVVTDPR